MLDDGAVEAGLFGFGPFSWPGALAEFPCEPLCGEAGCDSVFPCCPGAFAEFPLPFPLPGFPATAAPAKPARQRTISARPRQSRSFLRSAILSPSDPICTVVEEARR